jgi:predicted TIM-barrel fold metal-dependent hydrolase
MIIDGHMHILTGKPGREYLPARYRWILSMMWAYGGGPPYERNPKDFFEKVEQRISDPTGEYTIKTLDSAGMDAAVLIPTDYGLAMGDDQPMPIDEMHQHLGELQKKYPGRMFGFAGQDARRPGSLQIFERAVQEYGLKGLKILPHYGYYASDRILFPFYERADNWNIPVAICTNMEWATTPTRFNDPIHVGEVVNNFPDMNVILFHTGFPVEAWFEESLMLAVAALNMYLLFDAWVYPAFPPLTRGYANILNDEEAVIKKIARARDVVGAHRILFGTDNNCGPSAFGDKLYGGRGMKWIVEWWQDLPARGKKYGITFTPAEVELMMGDNLARLLGICDPPEHRREFKYGWQYRTPGPRPAP